MNLVLKFFLLAILLAPIAILPLACGSKSSPTSSSSGSSNTSTATNTSSPVLSATFTSTSTVTATSSSTNTTTPTNTPLNTNTVTFTITMTRTNTQTPTNTQTVTNSQTATSTKTVTNTQTTTNTVTATSTYTWTACPTSVVMGDVNTSTSYSFSPQGSNYGAFSNFTTTTAGSLRDIRVYMDANSSVQVGIYTNATTSPTWIASTPSTAVNTGGIYQWVYFYANSFTGSLSLSTGTTYSICVLMTGGNEPALAEDASGHNFYEFISNSNDMSSSFGSAAGPYSDSLEIAVDICN